MPIRSPRAMAAATTAALCLAGAIALAGDTRAPECEALDNSLLAVPDWYAARCLDGNAVTDHSRYTERADLFPGDPVYYKTLYPAPIGFAYGPLPFPPQL